MAIKYVKSGAVGAADGSSWANAYTTLTAAAAGTPAGDFVYVSHLHSESTAAAVSLAFAGTAANPIAIVCVNDTTGVLATSAIVAASGSNSLVLNGSLYVYGVTFRSGVGSSSTSATLSINLLDGNKQVFDNCLLDVASTGASTLTFGSSTSGGAETATFLVNSRVRFGGTAQKIRFNSVKFRWTGGGIESGSAAVTNLIAFSSAQVVDAEFQGVDLSPLGSSTNMIDSGFAASGHVTFSNCKLPSSWSGELAGGAVVHPAFRAEMHNCDSAGASGRYKATDFAGSINVWTAIVKTRTDWDGVTPYSYKMDVTNANTKFYFTPLDSPAGYVLVTPTGSPMTATVDILHDSVTNLTDADAWLEIQYLGTSGFPLGSFLTDQKGFLSTATDQTTSTAGWTTTGMTNPNKQKLAVTFTPQEAGFVQWRVMLAKPSITVYVDPKLQVT